MKYTEYHTHIASAANYFQYHSVQSEHYRETVMPSVKARGTPLWYSTIWLQSWKHHFLLVKWLPPCLQFNSNVSMYVQRLKAQEGAFQLSNLKYVINRNINNHKAKTMNYKSGYTDETQKLDSKTWRPIMVYHHACSESHRYRLLHSKKTIHNKMQQPDEQQNKNTEKKLTTF